MHARSAPATVVLAAALAATGCGGGAKPHAAGSPPPPSETPTATATPISPTPSPTPSPTKAKPGPILTDERTVALGFVPASVVPAGPVVYVIGGAAHTVTVARVDVATKTVTAQRIFRGDLGRASVGGGTLAVLIADRPATVALLDLRTLDITARRTLPAAADVLARPEAVYVSTPGRILALDPTTLLTRRSFGVDDDPQQRASGAEIAADPRSHILYAGIPSSDHPRIDVLDLRTGRLLARPRVQAVTVAEPQGYGDDSWAVFATGMMAAVELLTPTGHVRTTLYQVGPNSSSIAVTGRHLWTFTPGFRDAVDCRDLRTGAAEGTAPQPVSELAVAAADDTHVYLGGDRKLSIFTPSGACA